MPSAEVNDRPNLVVIHPHNLGRRLGCYGRGIRTPNIDSIATDGVRFENYFATASHCSPARGSMWTGTYPHCNGLVGLAHLGWKLHDDVRTLPQYLNELGYDTRLFGLQHISEDPGRMGYDSLHGSRGEYAVEEQATEVSGHFRSFLENKGREDTFFASIGFSEVHRELCVERCLDCGWTYDVDGYESVDADSVEPFPYLPDRPGVREELRHLEGMIHEIDDAVGIVHEALRDAGIEDDTLLIFTSDHGIGMPRSMGTCYDPGVEIPLLMQWPGQLDSGVAHGELISQVDFTPTILDLLGREVPDELDARSFAPLLTGGSYRPRGHLFHEFTWHAKYIPMRAIRTERFKFIRNFGDLPKVYLPAPTFSSESGKEFRDEYYSEQRPETELYDLEADPHETDNLVDDPEYADIAAELDNRLYRWMGETDDRLLDGEWPPTRKQLERIKKAPWVPKEVDEFC